MKISKIIRFEKQPVRLVGISMAFAAGYWIIESLRDMIVFNQDSIIQTVFSPGLNEFWLRVVVVLIIILFGTYVQTWLISTPHSIKNQEKKFAQIHIILMGLAFSVGYWVLEAVRDMILYDAESFVDQIIRLNMFNFWMRFLPVCMLMLFSGYSQSLFNRHSEIERNLRKSNKKLADLDQLKSDFLNTVSHELRTPIAIMKEGVSLCMDNRVGSLNETQHKLLTDTLSNIERLNRLVTDLLDLSKIEAGKMKLHRQLFDAVNTVKKVAGSYINQAKKQQIEFSLHSNAKSIPLYADEDKLIQILNNLLNNAFRFTMAGGSIGIHVADQEDAVRFQVRDTGIGIGQDDQKRLFSKFEQVERINVSGYKGTGLGLSICKGLVERHGGAIQVKSELGKGTIFDFTIKKEDLPKVLIVDDEKKTIELIQDVLKKERINTLTALDGMTALKLATEYKPALILLDLYLGKMSGYEVIGRLKQDRRTANIPVVIVSGFDVNEKKLETGSQHEIPMIKKPFNVIELKEIVQQNLAA